jgi:PST family polysaccharide transporter
MSELSAAPEIQMVERSRLSTFVRRIYDAGLLHLFLSTASVQGLAYLAQLAMARLLSPADFGTVRATEATVSILMVLGAFGMPTLAIKAIAHTTDEAARKRLLGALLTIAFIGSGSVACTTWLLAPHLGLPGATAYLPLLVCLIVPIAVSRTCQNYFQGIRAFQRIAVITVSLTVIALTTLLCLVKFHGLSGWICGRYAAEGLFAAALLMLLRHTVSLRGALPSQYTFRRLVCLGGPICLGLLVRVLLDNSGLIALGYFHRPRAELGACGLALLIVAAAMMAPSALSSVYLPRLAAAAEQPIALRAHYRQLLRLGLLLGLILMGLVLIGSPLVPLVFGAGYRPAVLPIAILSLDIPPSILAAYAAAVLLARDRSYLSAGFNIILTAVAFALFWLATPRLGLAGVAIVIVTLDTLSMLYFMAMAERDIRLFGCAVQL